MLKCVFLISFVFALRFPKLSPASNIFCNKTRAQEYFQQATVVSHAGLLNMVKINKQKIDLDKKGTKRNCKHNTSLVEIKKQTYFYSKVLRAYVDAKYFNESFGIINPSVRTVDIVQYLINIVVDNVTVNLNEAIYYKKDSATDNQ